MLITDRTREDVVMARLQSEGFIVAVTSPKGVNTVLDVPEIDELTWNLKTHDYAIFTMTTFETTPSVARYIRDVIKQRYADSSARQYVMSRYWPMYFHIEQSDRDGPYISDEDMYGKANNLPRYSSKRHNRGSI